MSSEKSLKSQNAPSLWAFFLFNIVLLLILFGADSFFKAKLSWEIFFSLRSAGIIGAYVIIFVINGQLSADAKAKIVFWRFKDALPGCRAFTHHGKKDYRVNMDSLTVLHGVLPTLPREQNQLWYKIYKTHQSEISVQKSQKDFLLARDMAGMAFLFLIISGLLCLFLIAWPWNVIYFGILIIIYLLMSNLARNHGFRFVTNVLALESAK